MRTTRVSIAAALLRATVLLAAVLAGCRQTSRPAASFDCPPGDRLVGAAPPRGTEMYCRKTLDGKRVKDGPFVVFADGGGKLIEGSYRDGVQQGLWTTWYENGQRSAIDHFHDGVQDGLHISWYANGQKAIEGNYRTGKREGVWTRWDPSGFVRKRETYRDDKVIS